MINGVCDKDENYTVEEYAFAGGYSDRHIRRNGNDE